MRRSVVALLAVLVLSPVAGMEEGHAASSVAAGIDPDAPVEITSESLEMLEEEQRAIFRGDVKTVQGEMTIRSDELEIRYRVAEDGSGRRSIETIRATGSVFVTSEFGILRSGQAMYDLLAGTLEASGGVVLERDGGSIRGEVFRVDLESGTSMMQSDDNHRVRAVFAPQPGGS